MHINDWFIDDYKLPKPLSNDEINDLFKHVKEGSKNAKNKLAIHNIKLVLYEVTTKFKNADYDKDELVCIGNLGLVKAINTYDPSKGFEFSTYATRCIDNEILMFLRSLKKISNVDSLDTIIFKDKDSNELKLENIIGDDKDLIKESENDEIYLIIRQVVENLPERNKEIIKLYFGFYDNKVYSQTEIAKKFNLSRSHISMLISKTTEKIGKILESKGVIELHSKQKPQKNGNEKMPSLKKTYSSK